MKKQKINCHKICWYLQFNYVDCQNSYFLKIIIFHRVSTAIVKKSEQYDAD